MKRLNDKDAAKCHENIVDALWDLNKLAAKTGELVRAGVPEERRSKIFCLTFDLLKELGELHVEQENARQEDLHAH